MTAGVSRETASFERNIAAQIEAVAAGVRKRISHGGALCCRCHAAAPLGSHRYCRACKRAYQAAWLRARRAEFERLRSGDGEAHG